jgi:hypothetical protein
MKENSEPSVQFKLALTVQTEAHCMLVLPVFQCTLERRQE